MAHSLEITQAEFQHILRLIGECRELGDDPVVWRQHFNAGLGRLVGAELVMSAEAINFQGEALRPLGGTVWGLEHGFRIEGYREMGEKFAEGSEKSYLWQAQVKAVGDNPTAGYTFTHQELLDDRQWYRSYDYQQISKAIGTDAALASIQPTSGNNHFDSLNLSRAPGRRKFNAREVVLARLVHQEAARLVGGPLAGFEEPSPSRLQPRIRQVLHCLLTGDSDKQIAIRLDISQHTVNQYTKQIYRHFHVSSRPELLARWLRRGWSNSSIWDDSKDLPQLRIS